MSWLLRGLLVAFGASDISRRTLPDDELGRLPTGHAQLLQLGLRGVEDPVRGGGCSNGGGAVGELLVLISLHLQLLFTERHLELLLVLLLINILHLLLIHLLLPLPIFLLLLLYAPARSIPLARVLEFFRRGAVDLIGLLRTRPLGLGLRGVLILLRFLTLVVIIWSGLVHQYILCVVEDSHPERAPAGCSFIAV